MTTVTELQPARADTSWTWAGLAVALLGLPLVVLGYRLLFEQTTSAGQLLGRELALFALLVLLLWIIRRKERLPLSSIGLRGDGVGRSMLWGLLATLMLVAGIAASMALLQALGLSYGSGETKFVAPAWVTLLIVLRAGIVEEVFYRGYAIERLERLTGNPIVASVLPLVAFAAFHYRQGVAGILIALVLGAILTVFYRWKRNLLANIVAHFLIDFVPNIVLPMFNG